MVQPKALGIIPARLRSTRLPGKLLLKETGKPLIQHTWEAACRAKRLESVLIAAEDQEFAEICQGFGATCIVTGPHPSGSDRIADVVRRLAPKTDLIVNIQGDEPEVDPQHIELLVELLDADPSAEMASLATPIRTAMQRDDPSCVKVVCDASGRAMYFSRSTIPAIRDTDPDSALKETPWLMHLGLYAYRRDFLLRFTENPPGHLEQLEKLEQLRALEMGATIRMGIVEHPAVGIDTEADYRAFVSRWSGTS